MGWSSICILEREILPALKKAVSPPKEAILGYNGAGFFVQFLTFFFFLEKVNGLQQCGDCTHFDYVSIVVGDKKEVKYYLQKTDYSLSLNIIKLFCHRKERSEEKMSCSTSVLP